MGIKSRIASPAKKDSKEMLAEKLYREERNYRADRLVEKWSHVADQSGCEYPDFCTTGGKQSDAGKKCQKCPDFDDESPKW